MKSSALKVLENAIRAVFAAVGGLHILVFMGAYVLSLSGTVVYDIDLYAALAALSLGLVYAVLNLTVFRSNIKRMMRFLRQLLCPQQAILALLLVWYVICCIKVGQNQHDDYLTGNAYPLIDAAISTLILFPLPMLLRRRKWAADIILAVPVVVSTLFMCYALVNLVQLNFFKVPGGRVRIDKSYSLLIACNRNITGAMSGLLLMLSVYLAAGRKKYVKALCGFAAAIQLMTLFLSNSRAAFFAVIIAFAFAVAAISMKKLGIVKAIAAGVLTGALIYAARIGFCYVFAVISGLPEYFGWESAVGAVRNSVSDLSGRGIAWSKFLPAMTHSKIVTWFGVTPVAFSSYFEMICGQRFGHMHNQYMQMGVCFGFPGLAIYIAWSVSMAVCCIKRLNNRRNILLVSIVGMLVALNMFESYLYAMTDFVGSTFFLLCGMLVAERK